MNKRILLFTFILATIFTGCIKEDVLKDLRIDKVAIIVAENQTKSVSITSGNNKYLVKSDDETIATAVLQDDNINISGVKEGETNVVIFDKKNKQKRIIKVTVKKAIVSVESITVNPEKITVKDTNPFTLEVTVLPENATNKSVRFESNNFDVAVVDENGVVTPTGSGQVVISVFTNDGDRQAICKLTVELPLPDGVVIEGGLLRAWPNEAIPDNGRVVIPDNVTEIRKYTFKNADRLKKIVLPDGLEKIGTGAFQYCVNLEEIVIPGSVEHAGSTTFMGCTNLKKAVLKEGVKKIFGPYFQDCTNLIEVSLPSTLEKIPPQAFSNCENLPSITIPKGVSEVSDRAIMACTKLAKINVDEENAVYTSVDGILFSKDKTVLWRCPSGFDAEAYTIPSTVTYIGANAFDVMTKLAEVTIPESVTAIGENAFYNLNNSGALKLIHCKSSTPPDVEGWGGNLGYEGVVKVPAANVDDYKAAKGWKDCTIEAE